MLVTPSPVGGYAGQFFDNNGDPLSGGKIYTYAAGTTTPQATYTSLSGAAAHTNPIVLDSAGRVPSGEIWLIAGQKYKFILSTATNVQIGSYDNINATAAGAFESNISNFTGNGVQISFSLLSSPSSESTTSVFINGVYQQKNTYAVSANAIVFSEAPPFNASIEVTYI